MDLLKRSMEFKDRLRRFWFDAQDEVMIRWKRILPFGDYVVDRWEKANNLGFGEGSSIYDTAYVFGDVKVGEQTWVGPYTILDGSGGLTIGSFCSVSAGVHIYTHDSVEWAVSGGRESCTHAPTVIGDHCYIGPYTVITMGVTIGSGCIIGAHSLVLDDIPGGTKAFGCPCRITEKISV